MDIETAEEILGVSVNATKKEIKSKFRTLAKKYHPDSNPNGADTKKLKRYLEAYNVLIDYEGDRHEQKRASKTKRRTVYRKKERRKQQKKREGRKKREEYSNYNYKKSQGKKSKSRHSTGNTKKQRDKKNYNSNDNYTYSQRKKESHHDNSVKKENKDSNFIPKWLQIIIGIVFLEKVFQKGILGKVVQLMLILALSSVFSLILFGVYMMAQLNISFSDIFAVIFGLIAVYIFGYMGFLISRSIIKKYKAYQKMKEELPGVGEDTYPKDIENIRQTWFTHNIETTFICGHCGHRNIVVTEALEFEVKCKFCKTKNIVKLKIKK